MAGIAYSRPGTEHGPCLDKNCEHTDCAITRIAAEEETCPTCGEPLGYERVVMRNEEGRNEHRVCLSERYEREGAR